MDDELRRALQGVTDDVTPVSSAEARARAAQARPRLPSPVPLLVVLVVFVLVVGGLTVRVVRTPGPGVDAGPSTVADLGDATGGSTTTAPNVAGTAPDRVDTDGATTTLVPVTTAVTPPGAAPPVSSPGGPPPTPRTVPAVEGPTTTAATSMPAPPEITSSTTSTTSPPGTGVVLRGDGLGIATFGQDAEAALAALDEALTAAPSATVRFGRTADTGYRDQVDAGRVRTVSWGIDAAHPALTVQLLDRTSGSGPAGLVWWSYTPVAGFPALHTAAGLAPPTTRAALRTVVAVEDRTDPHVDGTFPCFTDRRGTVCALPAPAPADPATLARFVAGSSALDDEVSVAPPA